MSTVTQIKDAVRKRDKYKCVRCDMSLLEHVKKYGKVLDVHRKTPGSRYDVAGCETLCRGCHSKKPKLPRGQGKVLFLDLSKESELQQRLIKQANKEVRSVPKQVIHILRIHFRLTVKSEKDEVSGYEDVPRRSTVGSLS